MKTLIILFLFAFLVNSGFSQQALFSYGSDGKKTAFIFEPALKLSELNDQFAALIGVKFAVIFLDRYEIGARINFLQNTITPPEGRFGPDAPRMELISGGIEPGYQFRLSNLFSFYPSCFVGYGYTNYRHKSGTFSGKYFRIVEPNISLSYRLTSRLEFKLGANYRQVFNVDKIRYSTVTIGFSPGAWDVPIELNHFNLEAGLRIRLTR